MRAALALFAVIVAGGCGQPEDLLLIDGRVVDATGNPNPDVPLTLYRDEGATDFGCSDFSVWQQLSSDDAGFVHVEHLREQTTGRFGLTRCLRLEWNAGGYTSSLSWLGRPRNTALPDLIAGFPLLPPPSLPTVFGGVLPPAASYEVRDDRGVIFRQPITDPTTTVLQFLSAAMQPLGAGPAPARDSAVVPRFIQHGQEQQVDALEQTPLLQFEFRIATLLTDVHGDLSYEELAHGSPCNVQEPEGSTCALTDGLFEPIDLDATNQAAVEITLPNTPAISVVVVHGIWANAPFTTLIVEGQGRDEMTWVEAGRLEVQPQPELLATASFEDARPLLFEVLHWVSPLSPIAAMRVRLVDGMGKPVPISWISEISIY